MIVETLLQDTASKLKAIAHHAASVSHWCAYELSNTVLCVISLLKLFFLQYVQSFMSANREDERIADRRVREVVCMAIEG